MIRLDFLIANFGGFRWQRVCCRLGLWFATQTQLLCHGGSMLGIGRGRQCMIGLQTPAPQIFLPAQSVSGGYVAAQGFSSIPAFQTNHVIVTHRLPH
jgi:hypothetical protein